MWEITIVFFLVVRLVIPVFVIIASFEAVVGAIMLYRYALGGMFCSSIFIFVFSE